MFQSRSIYQITGDYYDPILISANFDNYFFLVDLDRVLRFGSGSDPEVVFNSQKEVTLIKASSTRLVITVDCETNYLYDVENGSLMEWDLARTATIHRNVGDSSMVYFTEGKGSGVFDLIHNKVLFEQEKYEHIDVVNDKLFKLCDNFKVKILSQIGVICSEFILSNKTRLSKLLGVAHNHLFILTKDNRIIVLNVDDGSLVKTFEWTEPVDGTTYLPGLSEAFLNPEDQCIYCLGNILIKIDTRNLEILTCRHVSTSFDAMAEITVKNSSYQGRYISFTGWSDEYAGRGRVIGLFDIESEEFLWTEELSQFIPAFHTPQLCKDKLYILDIENTLHIFERFEPG